jgi:hypothetical protein
VVVVGVGGKSRCGEAFLLLWCTVGAPALLVLLLGSLQILGRARGGQRSSPWGGGGTPLEEEASTPWFTSNAATWAPQDTRTGFIRTYC